MITIFDKNLHILGKSEGNECKGTIITNIHGIKTNKIYIYVNYQSKGKETGIKISCEIFEESIREYYPITISDEKGYKPDERYIYDEGRYIIHYDIPLHVDIVCVYIEFIVDPPIMSGFGNVKAYIIPESIMN